MFKHLKDNNFIITDDYYKKLITNINDMLHLQQTFNNNTNGINWEDGVNKFGKEIDWFLCINLESAEAIESTPWKHWKNIEGQVDWNNIKTELVDIWHFILSQSIVNKNNANGILEIIQTSLTNLTNLNYEPTIGDFKELNKTLTQIQCLCTLDENTHNKLKLDIDINYLSNFKLDNIITLFVEACFYADLSFEELYSTYVMKNCLNAIRQDNGYKEGTYIKNWNSDNGVFEDNVICRQIWDELPIQTYDILYKELTKYYNKYNK